MNKSIQLQQLKLGIPVLIILSLVLITRTTGFQNAPEAVSLGILLDLLITIPVVYYLLIRKTQVPKFTIIYPFLIGLFVAGFIIPIEQQQLLLKVRFVAIPLIELGVVSMLIYKVISLKSSFKKTRTNDFYDKLLIACKEVFPNRIGKILAAEIAVGYYLFAPIRKKGNNPLEFTCFKKSGIRLIIGVFLFLILMETIILHLLVSKWDVNIAWFLSFLGVYTMIQIFSVLRSMNSRLIRINQETENLNLRYGFGCQSSIPFTSIKSIKKTRKTPSNNKSHVCLSLFDLIDSNNIIIYLHDENTLHKMYGIEKKYQSISLFVDEVDLFIDKIEQLIVDIAKPEETLF